MKPSIYKGWVIDRSFPSGYYAAWKSGEIRLMADTVAGIRRLITDTERGNK